MPHTYTPDDLQRLAHEAARVHDDLTPDEVLGVLYRYLAPNDEGHYTFDAQADRRQTAVATALLDVALEKSRGVVERRPEVLDCDVWRFQNKKEKWVAFVGLMDGRPYEIFTGLQDDEEGIALPKSCHNGCIIKHLNADGTKRYDFQFKNRRGYKTTVEGLSERFNKEYWNYAKLISGVLRYRMPLENVIKLIDSLQLETETINTWKAGVVRALKKYTGDPGDPGDAAEPDDSDSL